MKGLADTESGQEVAFLRDVTTAFLKEPHGHGDSVEQDLATCGALCSTRYHLEESPLATP